KKKGIKKKNDSGYAYWDELIKEVNGYIESPTTNGQEDEGLKKDQGKNALLIKNMSFSSNIRMHDIVTKKGVIKKKKREDSNLHFAKSDLRSHHDPLKEKKEGISLIKVSHHYPPSMPTCREEKGVLDEENEGEKHAALNSKILSLEEVGGSPRYNILHLTPLSMLIFHGYGLFSNFMKDLSMWDHGKLVQGRNLFDWVSFPNKYFLFWHDHQRCCSNLRKEMKDASWDLVSMCGKEKESKASHEGKCWNGNFFAMDKEAAPK
ncbi:hypothetical protein KI387_028878, partial [Taxus chinensis]